MGYALLARYAWNPRDRKDRRLVALDDLTEGTEFTAADFDFGLKQCLQGIFEFGADFRL